MLIQQKYSLLFVVIIGIFSNVIQSFSPAASMPRVLSNVNEFHKNMAFVSSLALSIKDNQLRMVSDDGEQEALSFDDAGAAIVDEDEKARAERSGSAVTEQVSLLRSSFRLVIQIGHIIAMR